MSDTPLVATLRTLVLDEQRRQSNRFVEGVDLDAYLSKLAAHAEVLSHTADGRCLGCVAFYANDLISRQAFISLVIVSPEARGMGLGSALVGGVLAICRARGFHTCRLEVRSDNAAALALYLALGFAPVEERGEKRLLELRL